VLADAKVSMAGMTVGLRDTRDYYNQDTEFIVVATIIIVLLILMALLRAIVAPLYLILSVLISYASALGIGVIVFQFLLGQELHWSAPGLTFILLVAVGADYNLLLISRIRDESPHGVRSGVIRTVGSTGGVITSAGLIFAASMFGLTFASISTMVEIGFIIGIGILLDTFLVRTITVPAVATLIGRANWWPSQPTLREKQAKQTWMLRRLYKANWWPSRFRPQVHAPVRRAKRVSVFDRVTSDNRGQQTRAAVPPAVANPHRHGRHEAEEDVAHHALPQFGTHAVPKQPTTNGVETAVDGKMTANGQHALETNGKHPAQTNGHKPPDTNGHHPAQTNGHKPPDTNGKHAAETNGHGPVKTPPVAPSSEDDRLNEPRWIGRSPTGPATFAVDAPRRAAAHHQTANNIGRQQRSTKTGQHHRTGNRHGLEES
jgi:RND superfamily putative drug exporter